MTSGLHGFGKLYLLCGRLFDTNNRKMAPRSKNQRLSISVFSVGIYNTKLPFATSVSLEIVLYLFLRKFLQVY